MHKKKVMIALALASVLFTSTVPTDAAIKVQDLHTAEGTPALALKKTPVYLKSDLSGKSSGYVEKGKVIRVSSSNKISYNGLSCYLSEDNLLTGNDLDKYIVKNASDFDKKVTTKQNTKLYDTKTYKEVASVASNTSFLIKKEDSDFYTVVFDDNEALLYKDDANPEIYVKVTSYDNSSVTIKELLKQIDAIAKALGISADKYKQLSDIDNSIVQYACKFIGNPYVWGGTSLTDGADCSGFVQQVYAHFGVDLPRCSAEQAEVGASIKYADMQPGDLLFFKRGVKIGHVAMYAGNGKIVHAKGSKYGIVYEDLHETPVVIKRVVTTGDLN